MNSSGTTQIPSITCFKRDGVHYAELTSPSPCTFKVSFRDGKTKGGACFKYWSLTKEGWIYIVALLPRVYNSQEAAVASENDEEVLVFGVEVDQCPVISAKGLGGAVSICGKCGLLWKGRHKSLDRHDYRFCDVEEHPVKRARLNHHAIETEVANEDLKTLAGAVLNVYNKLQDVRTIVREKVVWKEDHQKDAEISRLTALVQQYKEKYEECNEKLLAKEEAIIRLEGQLDDATRRS